MTPCIQPRAGGTFPSFAWSSAPLLPPEIQFHPEFSAPISIPTDKDPHNRVPQRSLTMGGYKELWYPSGSEPYQAAVNDQTKYLRDKSELEDGISACAAQAPTCQPRVRDFAAMIDYVRQIPDQLIQIEIVNAWLNMIPYDWEEERNSKTNMEHHSLVESLTKNLLVCDELARLKLFALERLGFPEDDIRWVALDTYLDGKAQSNGHAFTEVRIGDKIWIMNIRSSLALKGVISAKEARDIFGGTSQIEQDGDALNISKKSISFDGHYFFVPIRSFNSVTRGYYQSAPPNADLSNVPPEALTAAKEVEALDNPVLASPDLMGVIVSAVSARYTLHSPIAASVPSHPSQDRRIQHVAVKPSPAPSTAATAAQSPHCVRELRHCVPG